MLDTHLDPINVRDVVSVNILTSHPHVDRQSGATIFLATGAGHYCFVEFPQGIESGRIVARVPCTRLLTPSYCHSFGMTERFFVLIEQPLVVSIKKAVVNQWIRQQEPSSAILSWRPELGTRVHLVSRGGKKQSLRPTVYAAPPLFFFHTINAFEKEGHVVLDVIVYEDASSLDAFVTSELRAAERDAAVAERLRCSMRCRPTRLVLPILESGVRREKRMQGRVGENLVRLLDCKATALLQKDGSVHLTPEWLTPEWETSLGELPAIDYERRNGREYRFFYGMCYSPASEGEKLQSSWQHGLMRCDTWTGDVVRWSEAGFFPSEAVFVARPTSGSEAARDCNGNLRSCNDKSPAASDEEDGVLLSLVLSLEDERQGFLLH